MIHRIPLRTPSPTARPKGGRSRPTTLLFAYGATMNPSQIAVRRSRPAVVAVARLPGWALGFFGHSEVWDSALETLVPQAGAETWGVVYALTATDLDRLDAWQGVKLDGGGSYFHYPVEVIGEDGATHHALFYRKAVMGEPELPSAEYLAFIAEGARARHLPAERVAALAAMPSRPARYPVPMGARDDVFLAPEHTCQC
ncbi:AnfR protein, required for Mo- and V-independent nitrogenase [Rhodovulum sp. PH10]|uniref:gamma-glutamylcyclotransferase family protein n=1 Tax=Rhodovulum sp. PH10 TaxID=1187851 RepID=UPI00027C222D|nr:gamma-glutamylcyclotransferase family protein [Rhodovulum sp. PH10]EJW10897.1 AnfR protein, required for Mo- and V-independent nitrogenase [Rhodovulum sp. PH10]